MPYNEKSQCSKEDNLLEEDGNNWKMNMDRIDNYFTELSLYAPHFLDDGTDEEDSDDSDVEEMSEMESSFNFFEDPNEISFAAERETNSSKYGVSDYYLFKDLLDSLSSIGHFRRIESLPAPIYFFSCINSLLVSAPQIEARSKLFFDIYEYLMGTTTGIHNFNRYECQLITIYLVDILLKECLPKEFRSGGS